MLSCKCHHCSALAVGQDLTTYYTTLDGDNEQSAILPPQCRHEYSFQATQIEKKAAIFKRPVFLHKPALSPAYKSGQAEPAPESVPRTFLSSVLPPLCSCISLIKFVWKFFWGFLSISILGNPRTPMQVTSGNHFRELRFSSGCSTSLNNGSPLRAQASQLHLRPSRAPC